MRVVCVALFMTAVATAASAALAADPAPPVVRPPVNRPAAVDLDPQQVRQAIDRGVVALKRRQNPDGSWPDFLANTGGVSSLCVLALINAGVPVEDAAVQKGLRAVRRAKPSPPTVTYSYALQTMALCAAEPEKDLANIRENVKWLSDTQLQDGVMKGAWGYPGAGGDNSNSQFALLALHEAERVGVEVDRRVWDLAQAYWERTQNFDGSWGYKPVVNKTSSNGTGSMTCAGITSLIIAAGHTGGGNAKVDGDRVLCCGESADDETAEKIRQGLAWLGKNFTVEANPGRGDYLLYYLYAVERVGRLHAERFFVDGKGRRRDWYSEGTEWLVRNQDFEGVWKGNGKGEDNPYVGTSLALLFLTKGRRPVVVSKLQREPADDWNRHSSDLAHLTAHVERRWKRDLSWQVIDVAKASIDDLLQSPVLFLSGRDKFDPHDAKLAAKLREYINQGGFIFAEACCDNPAGFDAAFRELTQQMFPEEGYRLTRLEREHPLWAAEEKIDPELIPELLGINVSCRTSVVYFPPQAADARLRQLSCFWELARGRGRKYSPQVDAQIAAALALGNNVLAYATNREPKYKYDIPRSQSNQFVADPVERGKLFLVKLQHNGGWNVAPRALINLQLTVSRELGLRVGGEQRDLPITDPKLFDYHLAFMHGRNQFTLNKAEREQLKKFVERGGVIFADAVCGSEAFATSFRKEMAAIWPDKKLERIPAKDPLFGVDFGGADLRQVNLRQPLRTGPGQPLKTVTRQVAPELEAIKIGEGYGVVFSPYDLSCALELQEALECPGYTREDAARLAINVILYSFFK